MNPDITNMLFTIGMLFLGGLFTVLWFLLRKKDEAQEDRIDLLFELHDKDVHRLQNLELDIAKKHYVKDELNIMFDRMERTFSQGFESLGKKFDDLNKTLTEHMRESNR